ncbi:Mu-like prophage major head subunit gpT family protein [Ectopseudomonas oleovorans]|uniref:Mu-like prophage major head subunit gpT family protein n=1 Tax=Ectopseudomonas oleovorans TaxID=301 RepID=UPI003F1DAC3D
MIQLHEREHRPWLGQLLTLREWIGARVLDDMAPHTATPSRNHKFRGLTVTIERDKLDDSLDGVFKPMFTEMSVLPQYHPESLVFEPAQGWLCLPSAMTPELLDEEHPVYANTDGTGDGPWSATWMCLQPIRPGLVPADTTRVIKPLSSRSAPPELTSQSISPGNSTTSSPMMPTCMACATAATPVLASGRWLTPRASR